MSLKEVRTRIDGYWKQKKDKWEMAEYQAWLTGFYTTYSIGMNLSKKIKYPDNPLKRENPIVDISDMDNDEIANVHEDILKKLDLMAKVATMKQ